MMMVDVATKKDSSAASPNVHQLMSMRNTKFCSQLFITYQPSGMAITSAMVTSAKKYFRNSRLMFGAEAPNTFRMPTSFVRFAMKKETNPNKPRQEMKMARKATI